MNKNSNGYIPQPIDTSEVVLSKELLELAEALASNTHDVWAVQKMNAGYVYGPETNDAEKFHKDLIPYSELSDHSKEYDRHTSLETLKVLIRLGWTLQPPKA